MPQINLGATLEYKYIKDGLVGTSSSSWPLSWQIYFVLLSLHLAVDTNIFLQVRPQINTKVNKFSQILRELVQQFFPYGWLSSYKFFPEE